MTMHRYSVYVLEASSSNRLTYFLPPLVSLFASRSTFGVLKLELSAGHLNRPANIAFMKSGRKDRRANHYMALQAECLPGVGFVAGVLSRFVC